MIGQPLAARIFLLTVLALLAAARPALPAALSGNLNDSLIIDGIKAGDISSVRKLLDEGASPNAKDPDGATASMHAAAYAKTDCLKLLLDRGADPNVRAESGYTALIVATRREAGSRMARISGYLRPGRAGRRWH